MRLPLVSTMLVFACGGSSPPAKQPEPVVSPTPVTRVPVEEDEDEPEEGVQIINSRGRMDPAVIEAGIAPHKEALGACYTANLNRRRWLGGQLVIHWDINREGTVTAVRLGETEPGTNLGNWQIEKCVLDIARSATFGKPTGGDTDFEIPLSFAAKGSTVTWDEDQALRAVGGQTASIDECTKPPKPPKVKPKRAKVVPPPPLPKAPKGPVTITLYVGPGGKAQSVGFAGKTVIDDAWAECAAKAALAWRLPDPRGSMAKLAITYPR